MKLVNRLTYVLTLCAVSVSPCLVADCTDEVKDCQSGTFGEAHFEITDKPWGPNFSKSILAEVGNRSVRANGTVGWRACEEHWLKVSGEYLTQKQCYDFKIGKKDHWVQQAGVGAEYKQLFEIGYFSFLTTSGYYSYAPSKELSRHFCELASALVSRRIAGSHAWGGAFGFSFAILCDGLITVKANYDKVNYMRNYEEKLTSSGFGATIELEKRLYGQWDFNLLAELRRPFHYYFVSLTDHFVCYNGVSAGLFASYTNGMSHLPSQAAIGIQAAYTWQPFDCCEDPCILSFLTFDHWAKAPAFYAPEVLAIAEKLMLR